MKFEVKTESEIFSKSSFSFVLIGSTISLIIILSNISIKLGTISRNYEINYLCKLLKVEKTSSNFRKLSQLTNQNTKQKMLELCREIVK